MNLNLLWSFLLIVVRGTVHSKIFFLGGRGDQTFFYCVRMFSSINFHDIVVFISLCNIVASFNLFTGNILQKKNYNFFRIDMALFLSADFHQGNEIFNVYSTGKQ